MEWKTSITDIRGNHERIRGIELTTLIQEQDFVSSIFLLLRGRLPEKPEARMMNALLTAAIDHGIGTASAMTARIVASAKNSMPAALAAGVLAMGDLHGGAIEGAAKFFQEHKDAEDVHALIKSYKDHGVRIPGYGHAILTHDERSAALFSLAQAERLYGQHCGFAETVKTALAAQSSKTLPLNIDGAMAAVLSDMGFDWRVMKGIFVIARMPGLVAQVFEEMQSGGGLRRLAEDEITYVES